ncbi:MAG: hypothetical protein OXF30_00195 [Candidatus Saccharibacteria bacterium]|nr:hypothetical protein [Candidatus Saccharibacteria bacterium]
MYESHTPELSLVRVEVFGRRLLVETISLVDLFIADNIHANNQELQFDQAQIVAQNLISLAGDMADHWQVDLKQAYANRLSELESRSSNTSKISNHQSSPSFHIEQTTNWHEIQQAQALHDYLFHQQVMNWSASQQLRHHTLHLIKLNGRLAEAIEHQNYTKFQQVYLADILAFGVILANLTNLDLNQSGLAFNIT